MCEDENPEKNNGMLCGQTNHLTSFALLLTGKNNDSSEDDYVLAWLSLAFVGLAIIICLLAVLLLEGRMYFKKAKRSRLLKNIAKLNEESAI